MNDWVKSKLVISLSNWPAVNHGQPRERPSGGMKGWRGGPRLEDVYNARKWISCGDYGLWHDSV